MFADVLLLDRKKVFELLLKNKADINNVNDLGETALFFIARSGGKYMTVLYCQL